GPRDFRGVVHVGKAGRNRIERFERADQLTGCEHLYVEPALGERGDRRGETLSARLKTRQGFGPDCDHLELAHTLRNRGPWKSRCCGRGPYAGAGNELAAIHDSLPVILGAASGGGRSQQYGHACCSHRPRSWPGPRISLDLT